jgi:hypothetical protein
MTTVMTPLPSAVRNNVGLAPAVSEGPALFAGIADGPSLAAHRDRLGPAPATWTFAGAEVPGSPLPSSWPPLRAGGPWWW